MAYVNVEEWSSDEVSNWMKGLEPCLSAYVNQLWEAGVSGKQLLQLAPDMLPRLGIHKIGHQELLLQAIAQLRNIHYQLDKETLQQLALRLSSRARSVYSELRQQGSSLDSDTSCNGREDDYKNSDEDENSRNENNKKASQKKSRLVSTATVAAVADCLAAVKTVVSWLNRTPFDGLAKYDKRLEELTELGIRLATISQRDQFAENQAIAIMDNCRELTKIADDIIQNDCNPLIIQPASLVVATIKKKHDDDLGVHLITTYDGVHQVSIIRPLTPAHTCGKLSLGDQLIQVNYDTVIGWTPEKVMKALSENPVEVILTVKKQPRHAPGAQQIYSYFKPFRLPSKKRSYNHGYSGQHEYAYRNNFSNNLNIYSLLDQAGSRQIYSTLPKAPPLASPDQPLQTGVPALRPVSPERAAAAAAVAAPMLCVGSPGAAREGRQSSVSFAVSEVPSNADASSSFMVSVPSSSPHLPLLPSSVHNASDSCIRLSQEDDDDDDDPFLSSDDDLTAHQDGEDDAASTSGASVRLYPPKPRAPVHRRATIPGDTAPPLTAATTLNQYIEGLRQSGLVLRLGGRVSTGDQRDPMIRSTAGQETRARPHTIGAGKLLRDGAAGDQVSQKDASEDRFVSGQPRVGPVSLPAKVSSTASVVDRDAPATKPQLSLSSVSGGDDGAIVGPSPPTVFDTPLPFTITSPPTPLTPNPPSTPHTPGGRRVSEDRPRLDKSHSTPAYDFGSESAPNSTTTVSGPSSTALLVPGSAPAASSGGHRNLLLPGAEPNAKVQAGASQKKHLPAPGETKKVKIGSAKLKQSTFYCDDVESSVGDSVFYVERADPHVKLASSPSITLEPSPCVTEDSNSFDKISTLPDAEAQPSQVTAEKKLVALEPADLSRTIGKTTPLRERRTARLQPLTNLTIDRGHLSIHDQNDETKNTTNDPVVDAENSASSSQEPPTTEVFESNLGSARLESKKAPEPCSLYLPILAKGSSASSSKTSPATHTCDDTFHDSGKSPSPRDQDQSPSLQSGSVVKRPSSWTESVSGDLGNLEEPVTILSAAPRDYSARDDYKVFSRESVCSSVGPNSVVPTEIPDDRDHHAFGTAINRDDAHSSCPDTDYVPPSQNSLKMEIESTLLKNQEVPTECAPSDENWLDSASQTLSIDAQIDSGRRPGVCGGGRGISCRELGAGDHQGWLYRRSKGSRHFLQQHTWEKRWFILKKGYLYGYSGEDALKAESLIYLPGFHVCPAQDAKTKKFAFKIYHANGATFYFACDTSEERSRWMSEMGLSALSSGRCGGDTSGPSSPAAVAPTAAASPASSSSCSSPTLLPQHLEEAYYSETDDELDDSSLSTSAFPTTEEGTERYVPMAATASTTAAALTSTASTSSSSSAFSSLFHWGSGGKSSSSAAAGTSGVTSSVGSGRTSALSSFLKPKQIQAVPSANFRSYRRVREPGRSTSTSDLRQPGLCEAPPLTPTTPKPVSQQAAPAKANAVARKGSLREKLRSHLPSALTLDRRRKAPDSAQSKKRGKMDSKTFPVEVSRDKSDSTLSSSSQEKILEESTNMENVSESSSQQEETSISLGRAQVSLESGGRMELNEAEFDASVSCEDKGNTPRSSSSVLNDSKMQPVTPLKCKLIDASLKGSLDCLSSTACPYGTHYRTAADGSQKMWISTLRSPSTQPGESITGPFKIKNRPSPLPRHHSSSGTSSSHFSSNPNSPKSPTDGFGFSTSLTDTAGSSCSLSHTSSLIEHRSTGEQRPSSVERLKRTGNYKPVILKSKEPMRAAFVMGLDHDTEMSQGKHSALTSTPNSSQFSSSSLGSSVRPQVPPRTKFLSPSERIAQRRSDVSLGASSSSASFSREDSKYNTALSPSSTSAASILESSLIFSPISAYKNPLSAATSSTLENRPRGGLSSRLEIAQLPTDDQEQPKTPLKYSASLPPARRPHHVAKPRPTMGVCMIGKQRRTPGVLSPREVFFCSPPPSPSATTSPALTTSGSVSSSLSQHHYLPNTTLASTSHNPTPTHPPSRPLSGGRQPASSTPVGHASSAPAGRRAAGSRSAGRPPSGSSSVGRYTKHHAEVVSGDKGDSTTSDDCSNVNRSVRVTSYTGPDGKPLMVLPHYPDMEYPPTFEAGSYTIPGFTESSTPCSHPPCTSYSSSQPFTASSVSSSTQKNSENSRSHPYTPSYTPRTPRSPTLYYNLQGFNSASLPSLPSQDTDPPNSATQRPHQSSSKLYSDDVSSASSLPSANLPLSQRPQMPLPHSGGTSLSVSGGLSLHIPSQPQSSPQVSPHSSGSPRVIVGISCSGSDCVVSHHHSIYVTSPVKPNKAPSSHDDVTSCAATGTPYGETQRPKRVQSSADVVSPTSTREPIPKQSRRRTPPGSFTTSQSNSSLDSISEHASMQRPGNASIHLSGNGSSSRSGGCATVFDPLKKSDSVEATREGVNFGNFQFGGSSGGTVITTPGSGGHYSRSITSPKTSETQVQSEVIRSSSKDSLNSSTSPGASGRPKLDPPRLVLPGPPSDPPPDD